MKILVTGGTIFVSKFVAKYFAGKGSEVYVLNRNNHAQLEEVTLIQGDRLCLGNVLKKYEFDVVLDVTSYTGEDVSNLLDALGKFGEYILVSSSAVYPETLKQPFTEDSQLGPNKYWGTYGTNKIDAERVLMSRNPDAYVLRPPYLYGEMNNVYREAFVFECAMQNREFYLPKHGEMKLQFFNVYDLCRMMENIIEEKPENHIYNVGNEESVSIKEWVELCYEVVGKTPKFVEVMEDIEQRNYFSFYNYEYDLDITLQKAILPNLTPLKDGLKSAYLWYKNNTSQINRKDYIKYIDDNLLK